MTRPLAAALLITLSLAACNKAPAPPAPPAAPAAPAAPAEPALPAAAPADAKPGSALGVAAVDLGTSLGADGRMSTALEKFASSDTIIVAITLNNGGTPSVNATVTARWFGPDNVAFNEESQQKDFGTGMQTLNFRVADPKGFKSGAYRIEVALNGSVVQNRTFSVK